MTRRGPGDDLAARVLRGGTLLLVRQLLGAVLAFAGMLALARLLGPAQSGLYFTAFGIVFFAQNITKSLSEKPLREVEQPPSA